MFSFKPYPGLKSSALLSSKCRRIFLPVCLLLSFFLLLGSSELNAQPVTGDYQTFQSGQWSNPATWSRWDGATWVNPAPAPSNLDGAITVLNGHVVNVQSALSFDQVVVNSGGQLLVFAALNILDGSGTDLTTNGQVLFGVGSSINIGANAFIDGSQSIACDAATLLNAGTINNQLVMQGQAFGPQTISGVGIIGSLLISNTQGVTLGSDHVVRDLLNFNNGNISTGPSS